MPLKPSIKKTLRCRRVQNGKLLIAMWFLLWSAVGILHPLYSQNAGDVDHFFERMVYVEDLTGPMAWWANPAVCAAAAAKTAMLLSAAPVWDARMLTALRYSVYTSQRMSFCAGVSGITPFSPGGMQLSSNRGGFSASGRTQTLTPRVQCVLASRTYSHCATGMIFSIGGIPSSYQKAYRLLYILIGTGVLVPITNAADVSISYAASGLHDEVGQWHISHSVRGGVRQHCIDSVLRVSLEGAFRIDALRDITHKLYMPVTAMAGMAIYDNIRVRSGFSIELRGGMVDNVYQQGSLLNAGVSLEPDTKRSFFGEYRAGINLSYFPEILHTVYAGYRF